MDFGTTMYNFGVPDDFETTNSPRKILNVYRNGNPAAVIRYKIKETCSLEEHINYLKHKFKFKETDRLRIFNTEGLEIYPEDFKYLKDDSSIFISKGEAFNKSSTLCDYVVMRKLGEGSFGEVNLAAHKQTKQLYAIKFLKKPKQTDAAGLDRFFVEAETMKNLSHKNIVKIINCFTMKDMQIAMVMEYLEGGTLLDYVKQRKRLTEDEARHFFAQIVEGVAYCHANKVIHCDLKLENILLESQKSKNVKIIDFGISGLKTHFKAKIGGGSLHHMTPEFLTGKRKDLYSGIDIWALGCILFEMVCGKWAFYGENSKKIKEAICKGKFSFGSLKNTLSDDFKDLITKMLDMDPLKRITIVQIINHPWMNQPVQRPKEVPRQIVRLNTNVLEQMEKHKDVDDEANKKKYKDIRHLDQYLDDDDEGEDL